MHTANSDKPVKFYSLDVILAVGYRTNSSKAIAFRIWATKTLKQHLLQGYTINKKRIGSNCQKFMRAVEGVKALLPVGNAVSAKDALELINVFAVTWFSLDAYDTGNFPQKGVGKKQATELFGREKSKDAVGGIVGNVLQSFGKKDIYPTIEEKAARLFLFYGQESPIC